MKQKQLALALAVVLVALLGVQAWAASNEVPGRGYLGEDPYEVPQTEPPVTDPGTTDPGTTHPGTTDPGTTKPGTTKPGGSGSTGGSSPRTGDYGDLSGHYVSLLLSLIVLLTLVWWRWHMADMREKTGQKT